MLKKKKKKNKKKNMTENITYVYRLHPIPLCQGSLVLKIWKYTTACYFLSLTLKKTPVQDWSQCSSYIFISLISGVETRVHVTEKDNLVSWHF